MKIKNNLRVVSLFDGISCGCVALERAGYSISYYAAFEIDKYAKSISRYNYPDIEQCGDVMDADFSQFTDIDLLIGGSPCQRFSIAQSSSRETEKDSGIGWQLFMKYVEALRTLQPTYFLYENVNSMHKNIKAYITEELGVEPIMINSALVSAQQRKRLYWTNIPNVTQPSDKGILLKDILETGLVSREKSQCIDANYYRGGNHSNPHKQSGKRLIVFKLTTRADKSQTMLSTLHKENTLSMVKRQKKGLLVAEEVGAALRTREDRNGSFKRLEVRDDGKLNALTTVQTDSVVCSPVRIGTIGKGGQGERIYSVEGKTVCLSSFGGGRGAKTGLYKIDLPDGDYVVRKLTPIEAERCQTLPFNFTALGIDEKGKTVEISNSRRYMAIGNGWTCSVITHILSHME